eukprot:m.477650 g.477650  ORF g.477650 m.477650 type:complete len:145 (+) comp20902_c0_seq1:564-998(+)
MVLSALGATGLCFDGVDTAKVVEFAGHSGFGFAIAYVLGAQIGVPRPMAGDADATIRYDMATLDRLEHVSPGLASAAANAKRLLPPWVLEHGDLLLADLARGAVLNHPAIHDLITARLDEEDRATLATLHAQMITPSKTEWSRR